MKRILFIALMASSLSAVASPYVKLGYGVNGISTDEAATFTGSNGSALGTDVRIEPNSTDGVFQATFGYTIAPNFAVEASYQNFSADESFDIRSTSGTNIVEDEWNSDLKANRFSLEGLYLYNFSDKLQFNAGLGLTVTDYEFSYGASREVETAAGVDVSQGPIPGVTVPGKHSKTAVGAMASVGIDYAIWQNVTIGAEVNASIDGVGSTAQLLGTIGYRF